MSVVTIEIDKRPFIVSDHRIAKIEVSPIKFVGLAKAVSDANNSGLTPENATSAVRRARINTQAKFIFVPYLNNIIIFS